MNKGVTVQTDSQKSKEKILKDLEDIFSQRMKDEKGKPALKHPQSMNINISKIETIKSTPEIKDKGIMTEQEIESLEKVFQNRNLSLITSNRKKSMVDETKKVPFLNTQKVEEMPSRTLASLLSPRGQRTSKEQEDISPRKIEKTEKTEKTESTSGWVKVGALFKRKERKSITKKPSIIVKIENGKSENITEKSEKKKVRTGTVLYNFIAEMHDELTVNEGDIVEVIGDDIEGWTEVRMKEKIGYIPTAYFAEVTLPQTNDYREKILSEFYGTEVYYVENLKRMVEMFVIPLENILPQKLTAQIFANIKVVIGVNQIFVNKLESILKNETLGISERQEKLATVLMNLSVTFKLYVPYISEFEKSQKLLRDETKINKKLQQFLKEVGTELKERGCTITDIQSYMILPIQRLPRYRLLLADLLKNTPEEPKDVYEMMEQAYQVICKIVEYCNEKQREIENSKYLFNLQKKYEIEFNPSQKIIQELKKVKVLIKEEEILCSEVCLFDDILVLLNSKKVIVNKENIKSLEKEEKKIIMKMVNDNHFIFIVEDNEFDNFYRNLEKWK